LRWIQKNKPKKAKEKTKRKRIINKNRQKGYFFKKRLWYLFQAIQIIVIKEQSKHKQKHDHPA